MGRNHTAGINTKLQISIQPNIGLDSDARKSVMEILNTLLADEAVLTMKTHSTLWHMRGPGFLEMRTLFDHQTRQLNKISDEVAERVRMLGGFAISSFEEFINYTRLEANPGEAPDMMDLLADHEATVRFLREDARKSVEEYEDHGTYALFLRVICLHEKMAWILRSHVEPEISYDECKRDKVQSIPGKTANQVG
jgi:starvation-inducible DNA-binding protein